MNLTSLTSADVKKLIGLLEQKESLQAQVAKIDAELARIDSAEPAAPTIPAKAMPGRKPGRPAKAKPAGARPAKMKRAARGSVKTAILEVLKGAGESGIAVKDIAAKLGASYNHVFAWFYKTGSKIKEIRKAGPGKYRWVG